jgi:hypothetical protein
MPRKLPRSSVPVPTPNPTPTPTPKKSPAKPKATPKKTTTKAKAPAKTRSKPKSKTAKQSASATQPNFLKRGWTWISSKQAKDVPGLLGHGFLWLIAGSLAIFPWSWTWLIQKPVAWGWHLADAKPQLRLATVTAVAASALAVLVTLGVVRYSKGASVGKPDVAVIAKQEPVVTPAPAPVVKSEPAPAGPTIKQVINQLAAAVSKPTAPAAAAKVDAKPAVTRLDWADMGGLEVLQLGNPVREAVMRLSGDPEALKAVVLSMKGKTQHVEMWGEITKKPWPCEQIDIHLEVDSAQSQYLWPVMARLRAEATAFVSDRPVRVDIVREGIKPPAPKSNLAKS